MSTAPSVIVKKSGFLTALAYGFFTFLTTIVICAAGLGFYGLHVVDSKADSVFEFAEQISSTVFGSVPEFVDAAARWQEMLPPVFKDAVRDRRDPAYREHLDVSVRVVPERDRSGRARAVVTVKNEGSETVSLMAARVVLKDVDDTPQREWITYVATPLALCEEEWRGPLLPAETREYTEYIYPADRDLSASIEVTELRLWVPEVSESAPTPAQPLTEEEVSLLPLLLPRVM